MVTGAYADQGAAPASVYKVAVGGDVALNWRGTPLIGRHFQLI